MSNLSNPETGPFYVYLLISEEGCHYTGYSPDPQRRLVQHNSGVSHATKHGKNWRIVHTEQYATRSEAMKRERWLKSGVGRRWIQENIPEWSPADSSGS